MQVLVKMALRMVMTLLHSLKAGNKVRNLSPMNM